MFFSIFGIFHLFLSIFLDITLPFFLGVVCVSPETLGEQIVYYGPEIATISIQGLPPEIIALPVPCDSQLKEVFVLKEFAHHHAVMYQANPKPYLLHFSESVCPIDYNPQDMNVDEFSKIETGQVTGTLELRGKKIDLDIVQNSYKVHRHYGPTFGILRSSNYDELKDI